MKWFDGLSKLFGGDPELKRAQERAQGGDLRGAIRDLRTLIREGGATPSRFNALSWLLYWNRDFDLALEYSAQALASEPDNTEFMATHGRTLRRLGRFAEALPLIEARYQEERWDVLNATELCKVLVDLGRVDEAVQLLQELRRRDESISARMRKRKTGESEAISQVRDKIRQAGRQVS